MFVEKYYPLYGKIGVNKQVERVMWKTDMAYIPKALWIEINTACIYYHFVDPNSFF